MTHPAERDTRQVPRARAAHRPVPRSPHHESDVETAARRTPVTLDDDDIEAVAARVVELLRNEHGARAGPDLVDAATLARLLNVDRDWVYANARRLGAVRLGDGPKARLRFDATRARAALAAAEREHQPPPDKPRRPPRARPRGRPVPADVQLIQGRASR